jgi:hypothetical protein
MAEKAGAATGGLNEGDIMAVMPHEAAQSPSLPSSRWVARVAAIVGREQTVHFIQSADRSRVAMPFPDVVLIEGDATQAMTYRYRASGEFCGDTWDESVEAAKAQAVAEYGDALGPWLAVPHDVENAHAFARAFVVRPPGR